MRAAAAGDKVEQMDTEKTPRKKEKLTPKEEIFLEHFEVYLNATRAYMKAYPNAKRTTAMVQGCRLLSKPKLQPYIEELMERRKKRAQMDKTYLQEYLQGVVDMDPEEYAKLKKGKLTLAEWDEIPYDIRRYIDGVEFSETKRGGQIVNFKMFSKETASKLLAKITGQEITKLEHSGKVQVESISDLVGNHGGPEGD